MEIKARLNKPYTEKERMNFIVQYNHNLNYEVRETEEELQAWDYTTKEKAEQKKLARIEEIKEELAELDAKSIRPLRAGETEKLEELETQAEKLREELHKLMP